MNMGNAKALSSEEMKKVSGGAGSTPTKTIEGMENYASELKNCPKCGGSSLTYGTFVMPDGKSTKIGQICSCGYSWTFGNKTGVL